MEKQNTAPAADATESRIDIATVALGMTANNTVGAIEAAISILSPIVDPDTREACAALRRLAIKKHEQADRIIKEALHIANDISIWEIFAAAAEREAIA